MIMKFRGEENVKMTIVKRKESEIESLDVSCNLQGTLLAYTFGDYAFPNFRHFWPQLWPKCGLGHNCGQKRDRGRNYETENTNLMWSNVLSL